MSDSAPLWPPAGPRSVVLVLRGAAGEEARRSACAELAELLRGTDADVVSCETGGARPVDLGLVDVLARVALLARRHGLGVRLRRPQQPVVELLDLAGLDLK